MFATPVPTAPPTRAPSPDASDRESSVDDPREDIFADSATPEAVVDIDEERECSGVLVEWTPGSVWDTYPYHLHNHHSYGWEPIAFENNKWLRLRSKDCKIVTMTNDLVCKPCLLVPHSERFKKFVERADGHVSDQTTWMYLTHKQLLLKCSQLKARTRELQLKVSTIIRLDGLLPAAIQQ